MLDVSDNLYSTEIACFSHWPKNSFFLTILTYVMSKKFGSFDVDKADEESTFCTGTSSFGSEISREVGSSSKSSFFFLPADIRIYKY